MYRLIDIRTASILNAVVGLIFCAYLAYVFRTRKTYAGFRQWTIASLCVFLSMVLISLRDMIPAWATIVVSNILVVASLVLIAQGTALFTGRRYRREWLVFPLLATAVLSVVFTYYYPDVRARIVIVSVLPLPAMIQVIIFVRRPAASFPGLSSTWLVYSLGGLAFWLLVRVVLTVMFEGDLHDFLSASIVQGGFLVFYSAGNTAIFLGLLILHSQRIEADLQQALDEVRTLRGVIPICACCKKIRDDRGAWNQLEAYISHHSEAEFTHGFCPECTSRLMTGIKPVG